ncbi:MAG: response regulator [Acidobacteriota bacterium]
MQKESMLVVEDEHILRESLVEYFSTEDRRVDAAADGDKELGKYNLKDYNVMIVDLRLPGRDGLSILKEIKNINPQAKVIIVTAYPSDATKMEALRWGALNYLPKPFDLSYLETIIREPYEVPAPVVEERVIEEEIITPCIWMQAGIVRERMCTDGYLCRGCNFHAAMLTKAEFRNDPRIQPYLDKLGSLLGKNQCRYTMGGEISFRSCKIFHCANCELHQMIEYKVDQQLALKRELKKRIHIAERQPVSKNN